MEAKYFLSLTGEPYIYSFLLSDPEQGITELLELDTCRRLLHPTFHNASGLTICQGDKEDPERIGLVLQFPLPSYTLGSRLAEMNAAKRTAILASVGWALEALHKEGLYHGDIREENIAFRSDGSVVLVSWSRIGHGEEGRKKDVRDFLALLSRLLSAAAVSFDGPIREVMALPLFRLYHPVGLSYKEVVYNIEGYPTGFRDLLKLVVHWYRKRPSSNTKGLFLSCDLLYRVGSHLKDEGPNSSASTKIAWVAAITWIGLKFSQPEDTFTITDLLHVITEQNTAGVTALDIRRAETHVLNALRGCIVRPHLYAACRNPLQLKAAFDEFVLTVAKYSALTQQLIKEWASKTATPGPTSEQEGNTSEPQNVLVSSFF